MPAKTRREMIATRIAASGEVTFGDLAQEFDVSEMTIRRDIDVLEDEGTVRRVVGGAIAVNNGKSAEPPFASRLVQASENKSQIAEAAVTLIQPKETVILDSGSTVLAVAKAIRGRGLGLTILTPSILAAIELADEPDTTVFLTGGLVRPGELSLIGAEAEATFDDFNCDTFVMGIAGVDAARGVSEYHRQEGSVKKAAVRSADRVIVVADDTKLGRVLLKNIAPLSAIDTLVTDGDPDHPALVAARVAGVDVKCVPASGPQPADDEGESA